MCGRFSIASHPEKVAERFEVELPLEGIPVRYNAAPSQRLPVIYPEESCRKLDFFHWGLIPSWAKSSQVGYKMINARGETVASKPSFRRPFKSRRCLVLADSFYEWQKTPQGKLPTRFLLQNEEPFAFAGIWEKWLSPEKENIYSFAIITTDANSVVEPVHHRMPVILKPCEEKTWLNLDSSEENLQSLIRPYPSEEMRSYPVSPRLNSGRIDDPSLIEKILPPELQDDFFN